MVSFSFSVLFVTFFAATLLLRFYLAHRQMRYVMRHRTAVPAEFAAKIPLNAHQKAADYTVAKTRFGIAALLFNSLVLIGFTLLGGLQWLSDNLMPYTGTGMVYQLALIAAFAIISGVLDLPFDWYRQFVLEQRFGFNTMTKRLWLVDLARNTGVGIVLMFPLLWVILTLMAKAGALWWLYAWIVLMLFQLIVMLIYPVWIAPIFNKFTPLEDATLITRIEALLARTGFVSKGLFVMDGSKRSAHGNAYFSGLGASKRIVFYDTLLARLAPQEMEAVLAHELGHFKLRHNVKRIAMFFALSLPFLGLLGFLKEQAWFYTGLGVLPVLGAPNDAMALLLFMLVLPVFTFVFSPLMSISSRKHEFEADAFAAKHSGAGDLISALVRLYDDNASTLTPDPLHSTFFDSHPPASVRIARLQLAGA
jgi:STE24 endopeptidase